jgi:dihydrolipoamide dehydrogenase
VVRDRPVAAGDDIVARRRQGGDVDPVDARGDAPAAGVTVVRAHGTVTGPRTVAADGARLEAGRALVLATGSVVRALPGLRPDGRRVLTSRQALALGRVPASAIVLGGGAVGVEFAQVWHGLGAEVALVERRDHLVPAEDRDLGRELARALRRRGVGVHVGAGASDVTADGDGVRVTLDGAATPRHLEAEVVLVAVGRAPRSHGLGFERAGVQLRDGFVVPRDWARLETHRPGVFAVGDLLPPPSLARANTAFAEGLLVADAIAGRRTRPIDYTGVARITHGLVETAAVGLAEDEARRRGEAAARKMPIAAVAKGLMLGEGGMIKVVTGRGGTVLGIQLVAPQASELVGEALLVTGFEATPADVAPLVHPHPTLSELFSETSLALSGRRLHLR